MWISFPTNVLRELIGCKRQIPTVQDLQNVPHGKVTYAFYHSQSLDLERPLLIYTPPSYSENKRYPVLYLIHGMTDTHETWYKVGRMNNILDQSYCSG